MPSILRTGLVVAIVALATACSGGVPGSADGPTAGATAPSDPPTATGAPSGPPTSPSGDRASEPAGNADVLAFTAPTLDGGTFDASAYVGQDVILWMWAPW